MEQLRSELKGLSSAVKEVISEVKLLRTDVATLSTSLQYFEKTSDQHSSDIRDLYDRSNANAINSAETKPAVENNKVILMMIWTIVGGVFVYILKSNIDV